MKKLSINFKNCYGIQSLVHEFDFVEGTPGKKAFAIYAPNGLMKTSFTKTFEKISNGEVAAEERFGRDSISEVVVDGNPISMDSVYVLKSDLDQQDDSPAITNILVDPENKKRYDELVVDLDKQKKKLISTLQKDSGVSKNDVEKTLIEDSACGDFSASIKKLLGHHVEALTSGLSYSTLFDPKAIDILKSAEFIAQAKEFNSRYQELFEKEGTIYKKGVFNPAKADLTFSTLDKQGFFGGGHLVKMQGGAEAIGKEEFDELLRKINANIDGDEGLKKIRTSLAKNAQTQALSDLIENLPASLIDTILEKIKPVNQAGFKLELWAQYVQGHAEFSQYIELVESSSNEIKAIEAHAAQAVPRWTEAVRLFNDRFVDMPFTLSVSNHTQAVLGLESAKLRFTFKDGDDTVHWARKEIKNLSQGEKRALYLLNFIFEVQVRSQVPRKTLFIIDDVADSFDYKNKHAIVQYLRDLDNDPGFYQLILTHNFDFFRTVANEFVHRDRCLMANRQSSGITLSKAEGIKNYFVGILKKNVTKNPRVLCSTIPFSRNLIEYTRGEDDDDYLKLTSLLHWKKDSNQITIQDYFVVYNKLFETKHNAVDGFDSTKAIVDILFEQAEAILGETSHAGLNLEDKVLLSIAIRMKAEQFLINEIRRLTNNYNYWFEKKNQFGELIKEFVKLGGGAPETRTLEKVSITVSSNIHLNSFMYEPILDLTIEHLIHLYKEVGSLLTDRIEKEVVV